MRLSSLLTITGTLLTTVRAEIHLCNATIACPEQFPCCSQGGQCGTGQYCIGNCDPRYSFTPEACMPDPVCKNTYTKFSNYSSKILNSYTFLGNASAADWTYGGYIMDYPEEDSLVLAMPKNSAGTVLSSTNAVWYGKVSARLKTSHLPGVITAFILYSGVQDEIDFEWVGSNLTTTQTNYYWQGVLNYNNSGNITTTDTFENFHDYEIDWQEDHITWSVDGVVGRTLYKNETYNETTQQYRYPQTPSKVDISIWPGGNSTNAPGTIAWAGGEINWDAPDITENGYYYTILKEINVTCYGPPSGVTKNGSESYIYKNPKGFMQDDVAITDKRVYLGSDRGTGMDPDAGVTKSSSSSKSSSHSKTSTTSRNSTTATSTSKNSTTATSTSKNSTTATSTSRNATVSSTISHSSRNNTVTLSKHSSTSTVSSSTVSSSTVFKSTSKHVSSTLSTHVVSSSKSSIESTEGRQQIQTSTKNAGEQLATYGTTLQMLLLVAAYII
ncbi:chitin transglycosylase UTR2 KNAG_0G00480 [Huiozyma naganishii CBS 8797]|uniref:Crh-like protein n=1 Tax=Huiozyma naganishii (strain ATCC MYA-139 / BCRC 22969 / CBS 8797 / KCTC 17520 / NBRC 10181 / NCYC 3082 / Yp74L-3) TaxID=1071383 RepID=J7R8B5_HUIN7|nr:hypothetical protein KNAG_0G00480 [Kazachstania naganishii CBS 8797]CCK71105.1 hypothetical protein KNAG_0G00480 [Kazachstania naganishii CBS 8797]